MGCFFSGMNLTRMCGSNLGYTVKGRHNYFFFKKSEEKRSKQELQLSVCVYKLDCPDKLSVFSGVFVFYGFLNYDPETLIRTFNFRSTFFGTKFTDLIHFF